MFITLKRIIKSGIKNFWRNSLLSTSSILVITIALVVMLSTFFAIILIKEVVNRVETKVDIHIYFTNTAPEIKILELRNLVLALPEVNTEKTEYISREQVLLNFKEQHVDEKYIIEALGFLEDNPLGAILNIKAKDIKNYTQINEFLESKSIQDKFGYIISDISYNKNKKAIDTLNRLIQYTYLIGGIVSLILVLISIIVTFNTMRLTIYIFKEEISIMRLVGASQFFARGPFVVEGIIYGIISAIFALFLIWAIVFKTSDVLKNVFYLDLNVFFSDHIFQIAGLLLIGGISLGFISTYLAVSKYLKV